MAQIFNIIDDKVVINKLAVRYLEGTITLAGTLDTVGAAKFQSNLDVAGTLTANTIHVKNLVTENGGLDSVGEWKYDTEVELNGKGFTWETPNQVTKLMYRTGNRLWSNANLDLASGTVFSIDNAPVLTSDSLGETVVRSKLTQLGTLESLAVSGDVVLSDFAFFNSTFNRFGIGTDEPQAALSILDNNVEIIMGSPVANLATVGTYSSHDLAIVTDNVARITVKGSGEVIVPGSLRVNGTLFADTVQTDTRITRTHPLEFKATADTSIYGLGLLWTGTGRPRQLTMMANPDRVWTSENMDVGPGKSYFINGQEALTSTGLGEGIVNSNLTTLGALQTLTVQGSAEFLDTVSINELTATKITCTGFETSSTISFAVQGKRAVYADENQISIGDVNAQYKPVKVFGALSVGINNPDPSLSFSVNGDVNIGGKRFTTGLTAPTSGTYQIGDICWNTHPQVNSYVGWVCIVSGDPGQWLPFGGINVQ
mgnify:CR=1 FL=1